jgi:uncharacterized protein (TIGR03435 family)
MSWESQAIAMLSASLVRPFALAATAWLVLRVLRVRHPASQHAVWTGVLAGMLVLPILSVTVPQWKLPVLPAKYDPPARVLTVQPTASAPSEPMESSPPDTPAATRFPSVNTILLGCYTAGFLAMVGYRLVGWVLLRRVLLRSAPLRTTRLRESSDVLTPVVVGVLHPAVILPKDWHGWSAGTRRAVLAHEFAHLRRRDSLIAAFARWAKCVLWFHPLAWWIERKIADLAELACDAVVIERQGDPAAYSRILLAFADAVAGSGYRVELPRLPMAAPSGISQRIDRVFELSGGPVRKLSRPRLVTLLLGVPVLCAAATLALSQRSARPLPASAPPTVAALTPVMQPPAEPSPAPARELAGPPKPELAPVEESAPQQPRVDPPAPAPKPLAFDVASIKPSTLLAGGRGGRGGGRGVGGRGRSGLVFTPGMISAPSITARQLILQAYQLKPYQLSGGPDWLDSDRFELEAKGANAGEPDDLRQMLQTLLGERFQLAIHRETRETPVYVMSVAKGGFKLREFKAGDPRPTPPPGTNLSFTETMSSFADAVSNAADRPVLDKTGLTGMYIFEFQIEPGGDILTAAQSVGLKFEAQKAPIETIIVDRIEKPSEN